MTFYTKYYLYLFGIITLHLYNAEAESNSTKCKSKTETSSTKQVRTVESLASENVTLDCPVAGFVYRWQHRVGINEEKARTFTSKSVNLTDITYKDRGFYDCFVNQSSCGNGTAMLHANGTVYVTVLGSPLVLTQRKQFNVATGQDITLSIRLISFPVIHDWVIFTSANTNRNLNLTVTHQTDIVPLEIYGGVYDIAGYYVNVKLMNMDVNWTGEHSVTFTNNIGTYVYNFTISVITEKKVTLVDFVKENIIPISIGGVSFLLVSVICVGTCVMCHKHKSDKKKGRQVTKPTGAIRNGITQAAYSVAGMPYDESEQTELTTRNQNCGVNTFRSEDLLNDPKKEFCITDDYAQCF